MLESTLQVGPRFGHACMQYRTKTGCHLCPSTVQLQVLMCATVAMHAAPHESSICSLCPQMRAAVHALLFIFIHTSYVCGHQLLVLTERLSS